MPNEIKFHAVLVSVKFDIVCVFDDVATFENGEQDVNRTLYIDSGAGVFGGMGGD